MDGQLGVDEDEKGDAEGLLFIGYDSLGSGNERERNEGVLDLVVFDHEVLAVCGGEGVGGDGVVFAEDDDVSEIVTCPQKDLVEQAGVTG